MILSDRTLRERLAAGEIVIDPLDETLIQPSSVDVRISHLFRVFRNHTAGAIDVKLDQTGMTELVEMPVDEHGVGDEAFMLHPGEFVLGSTYERIAVPNDLVGRVEGKALSLATPVPTPDGWSTMGELRIGDRVFTDSGEPTVVVDATEVMLGRPCFEVEFSDGAILVADADHRWVTTTERDRRRGAPRSERTTREIAGSLRHADQEWNHHVHLSGSVRCPERHLPIDPYVLGTWIGDRAGTSARVTTVDDRLARETSRPERVTVASEPHANRTGETGRSRDPGTAIEPVNDSLSGRFPDLGLLADEHIPDAYLRASIAQRRALLDGLMDSDGCFDRSGTCEFTTTREGLAEQVHELVASLGSRPVIAKRPATPNGIDHGPEYVVTFRPARPVAGLAREVQHQTSEGRFEGFRAIVAVRPIPSVPVRCIEVAAPHGVYLAGRSFIPTHNSSLGRLGLLIHSTAGFIDAGFDGHITLELANVASLPITLYPGMKIGQVSFMQMTTPADHPYGRGASGSKYQGQEGPTPSKYFQNFR